KDFRQVARLHKEADWIPRHIPEIAFAHALQRVCEPILNKALKDISLAQLLLGLLQTAKNYDIQLQPQLLLLQKTLLNIESLCRHLDANVNMWAVIQPILNTWLKQHLCPIPLLQRLIQEGWRWLKKQGI
ncbi:MAG: ubiquinone biosynthesis regulatory protein kinase UbiB, partial [Gammaproteobacteria bacterium]|nr:ubiquinone biosynthesis regulatory protein kinase UbiB [Gammaproteobacteria bacterium]